MDSLSQRGGKKRKEKGLLKAVQEIAIMEAISTCVSQYCNLSL